MNIILTPVHAQSQVAKADLAVVQGKLEESLASLESAKADLAEQSRHASQLHSQVQTAQDKLAEARGDAASAETDLHAMEAKVAQLTDTLTLVQTSHGQAVEELQQQHVADTQVSFQGCMHAMLSAVC